MDDFRFLEDNGCWIMIIVVFLLLLGNNNGGFNLECLFNNFLGGCNNSMWMWVIVLALVWYFCFRDNGCGIFRNEIQ